MVTVRGRSTLRWCIAGIAALCATATHAADGTWPVRTVRLVVAQAPGAPPDVIARFVAQRLGPLLGTNVVVQNIAGASGMIGVEQVAHAAPDGGTLLVATLTTHVLVPHTHRALRYDPLADFTPVANLYRSVKVLWASNNVPAGTLAAFIDYARSRPGQLNYASGGVGSSNDIDAQLFLRATGLRMAQVPYNGPAAAMAGVASDDAQMMIASVTAGLPLAQAGRVRPVVVFASQRSPLLPAVPTASEAAAPPLDIDAWIGLMGPASLPPDLVARINDAVNTVLGSDEARAWAQQQGLVGAAGSSAAFAATLADDHARWQSIIRSLGANAER